MSEGREPKVGQIWHDEDRHDGRWWPYKIVRVNRKSYTVEPCHTDSLEPAGREWRYRIPKSQFDDHRTRHRPIA